MTLKRILSVMLVSVLVFVCVPFSVGAEVVDQDGWVYVLYDRKSSSSLGAIGVSIDTDIVPAGNYKYEWGINVISVSANSLYGGCSLTQLTASDGTTEQEIYRYTYYSSSYTVPCNMQYSYTFVPGFTYHIRLNFSQQRGPCTVYAERYIRYKPGSTVDTSHKPGGGDSRGGGAGRRWDYSEVTVKNGELEDPITGDSALRQDLQILNEADKKVNLVTPEGAKEYSYTNYTYNTETNTTTVYTTTNEIINITSTEEKVNVEYTDNSGQTTIYNYYYITEGGGSSSEPDTPGGSSSEPDTPGGDSSVPDNPDDGEGSGGGNIFTGIIDMITGLFSGLKSLVDLITTGIPDLLNSVQGFTDMLSGALSFIPEEIWALIALGVAAVIILRILGR